MKISRVHNATPQSDSISGTGSRGREDAKARTGYFIFRSLVPRLVHPTKLAIIEALIEVEEPLSVEGLIPLLPAVDGNAELIRYHATSMVKAGALEVASIEIKATAEIPFFYFPSPA